MREAARRLHALGPRWVVVKGGHMGGETVTDLLYDGTTFQSLDTPRIDTPHTHGTGCTFSAAMTACLAKGQSVPDAFAAAKRYTHAAIAAAPGLGHGHGPLNHLVETVKPGRTAEAQRAQRTTEKYGREGQRHRISSSSVFSASSAPLRFNRFRSERM